MIVVIATILFWLTLSEFSVEVRCIQSHEFLVDSTLSPPKSLQINIDITVAMECRYLRADVLDLTKTSIDVTDSLKATTFEFTSQGAIAQKQYDRRRKVLSAFNLDDSIELKPDDDQRRLKKRDFLGLH
jgi:hypothetical protein